MVVRDLSAPSATYLMSKLSENRRYSKLGPQCHLPYSKTPLSKIKDEVYANGLAKYRGDGNYYVLTSRFKGRSVTNLDFYVIFLL